MAKKQQVCIDDSDIHKLKKYGVISFGYTVTLKYVKDKINNQVVIHGE
jgi:hypothetical protein